MFIDLFKLTSSTGARHFRWINCFLFCHKEKKRTEKDAKQNLSVLLFKRLQVLTDGCVSNVCGFIDMICRYFSSYLHSTRKIFNLFTHILSSLVQCAQTSAHSTTVCIFKIFQLNSLPEVWKSCLSCWLMWCWVQKAFSESQVSNGNKKI